jgi:hypothetical protein
MQWTPALIKRTAHAFAHARLAVHATLLRAELPGIGAGDHAIWEFDEKPLLIAGLWLSRRGYNISLSMDFKYVLRPLQVWA